MMFLIQGFFFQEHDYLDVAVVPIEGAVPVIKCAMFRTMFAGVIYTDPSDPSNLIGALVDNSKESSLTEIVINKKLFRFKKQYVDRSDVIIYEFIPSQTGNWIGQYQGERVGRGVSRCLLTKVDDQFADVKLLLPPFFHPKGHLSSTLE